MYIYMKYTYIYIYIYIYKYNTINIYIYIHTQYSIYIKYTHVILIFIEAIAYSSLHQVVSEIIWPETAGKGIGPQPV